MNLKYYILLLFSGWFLSLSGQSGQQININERVERDLSSEQMDMLQINDFQNHSIQKLIDFSNYLNLISDTSLDQVFRQHAMKLALHFFVAPDAIYKYHRDGKVQSSSIKEFLSTLSENDTTYSTTFSNIIHISPSQQNKDGSYEWVTQYLQKQQQDDIQRTNTLVTMKIRLKKIEKKFGDQTKHIWELFLDEVIDVKVAP